MPVKTCLKLKSSLEIIEFPFPSARVTHLFQPETRHGLHSPSTEILQRSPDFARRLDFQWMQPATNPTYNRCILESSSTSSIQQLDTRFELPKSLRRNQKRGQWHLVIYVGSSTRNLTLTSFRTSWIW